MKKKLIYILLVFCIIYQFKVNLTFKNGKETMMKKKKIENEMKKKLKSLNYYNII